MQTSQALKSVATGQQPAAPQPPRDNYQHLKSQLEKSKGEFLPLFGGSMKNVDMFIRVVLNAVLANPELLEADRRSLINSCMRAAQDGLLPDGREAVLNIYNTNVARRNQPADWRKMVQYLPMVGGLVKKMYATGDVLSVDAAAVFANDRFIFRRGDDPKLEHEPTMADDCGPVICSYAVIKLKSGEIKREVMPKRDIELVRSVSKAGTGENSPWVKWYDQQAIKSVLKRIYKQLPKSDAFEQIEASDNHALGFAGTPTNVAEAFVSRHGEQAPALEHSPSEVLEPTLGRQSEMQHIGGDDDQQGQQHQAAEAGAQGGPDVVFEKFPEVAAAILKATTNEELDAARARIPNIEDALHQAELNAKATKQHAEINKTATPATAPVTSRRALRTGSTSPNAE